MDMEEGYGVSVTVRKEGKLLLNNKLLIAPQDGT